MKKKITKIWGVGLVLVLLVSLFGMAVPVSASTNAWGTETIPTTTNKVLLPGSDVLDIAVAGDGETVYAACLTQSTESALVAVVTEVVSAETKITVTYTDQDGTETDTSANITTSDAIDAEIVFSIGSEAVRGVTTIVDEGTLTTGKFNLVGATSLIKYGSFDSGENEFTDGAIPPSIFKSTDAGGTWTALSNPSDTYVGESIDLVAVAPDDADVMGVVADGKEVYVTTNGGSTWKTALRTVQEGSAPAATALYDIDISAAASGVNYIAVAGIESSSVGNVWRFNLTVGGYWVELNDKGGFGTSSELSTDKDAVVAAKAVAFSPNFASDKTMVAVTADYDSNGTTDNVVSLQIFSEAQKLWNTAAGWTSYPASIVSGADADLIDGITSASLSLAPTYLGSDDVERVTFVGLTIDGSSDDDNAEDRSGIWRLKDYTPKQLGSTYKINSIAYNGTNLVTGEYDSNYVRRSDDMLATTPTITSARSLKRPSVATSSDEKVVVAWAGSNVIAGTSGPDSAFAVSENEGLTFNDISLIDTKTTDITDTAAAADGSVVYMVSDDGTYISLWRMASAWERVFTAASTSDFIVRLAPDDADTVYLAKTGAKTIYYSKDGGETKWFTRTCGENVQDLAVESADTLYALSSAAKVTTSTNAGFTWATSKSTKLDSNTGHSIVSVSEDVLLCGSTNGYVAYSLDGNSSWTKITKVIEPSALKVQVVADADFANNNIIYAATSATGQNVEKWTIGTSTSWSNTFQPTPSGGFYGLAMSGSTLYALEFTGTQSLLWQCIEPTKATYTDATYWNSKTTSTTTDAADDYVYLNAAPRGLKASAGKLWAVKTNGTNRLCSFTDGLAAAGPALLSPPEAFSDKVNNVTGYANEISFSWSRPSTAKAYNLYLAYDDGFDELVTTVTVPASGTTTKSTVVQNVGPDQADEAKVNFMPGTTYYWRVKATEDLFSQYSETRTFTVEPGVALVPTILSPVNGKADTSQMPSFSWSPVSGTGEYQFVLANNVNLSTPIVSIKTVNTGYAMTQELAFGESYYWAVKSLAPVEGGWSAIANFTVKEKPVAPTPPVIVKEVPAPVINIPPAPAPIQPPEIVIPPAPAPTAPVPQWALLAIIIIGAVLVIAVLVLIVRTRRAI